MGSQRVGHNGATFSLGQQIEYPSKGSWLHRAHSVCDDTSRGLEHLTHNADAQCHMPKPPRSPFDFSATAAVCSLSRPSSHAAWRALPIAAVKPRTSQSLTLTDVLLPAGARRRLSSQGYSPGPTWPSWGPRGSALL